MKAPTSSPSSAFRSGPISSRVRSTAGYVRRRARVPRQINRVGWRSRAGSRECFRGGSGLSIAGWQRPKRVLYGDLQPAGIRRAQRYTHLHHPRELGKGNLIDMWMT